MPWPFLSPTSIWGIDTTLTSAPTSLTPITTAEVLLMGCDVLNTDTAQQTYQLQNTAGIDIIPVMNIPPGGAIPFVPMYVSRLRKCAGLKEIASSANVKRQVWAYNLS